MGVNEHCGQEAQMGFCSWRRMPKRSGAGQGGMKWRSSQAEDLEDMIRRSNFIQEIIESYSGLLRMGVA